MCELLCWHSFKRYCFGNPSDLTIFRIDLNFTGSALPLIDVCEHTSFAADRSLLNTHDYLLNKCALKRIFESGLWKSFFTAADECFLNIRRYPGCERALDLIVELGLNTDDVSLLLSVVNALASIARSNPQWQVCTHFPIQLASMLYFL